MDPAFRPGDEVRLKSRPDLAGTVRGEPIKVQGEHWYNIYFGPGKSGRHPEADLEPYRATTDVVQLVKDGRFAGREAFSKLITQLKLVTALRSHVYALQASRTDYLAYQFKPVLKFLESWKHRLLIADEVGLGKTIEAGLILTEVRARQDLKRVLIVPPSHLVTKWQREMKRRFDLDFDIFDRSAAMRFLDAFEGDGDVLRTRAIIPLQTLRGRSLQERWAAIGPTFDLIIYDEAGRLRNPETLSHRAAREVAESSDGVVMLTATPIQTGWSDLFNLLKLLDPEEFASEDVFRQKLEANEFLLRAVRAVQRGRAEDLVEATSALDAMLATPYGAGLAGDALFQDVLVRLRNESAPGRGELVRLQADLNGLSVFGHVLSRTRKREIHMAQRERRPSVLPCEPHELETRFYQLVTALCRDAYSNSHGESTAGFAIMMPQRQMASCMPAMVAYCKEKAAIADDMNTDELTDLRSADYDTEKPGDSGSCIEWHRLGDLNEWEQTLQAVDTKWQKFLEVMQTIRTAQPSAKIVVFSYFKKTLAYLERRLQESGIRTVLISGDVPSVPSDPEKDERGRRIALFESDPSANVLLSTEVGNEGLDLQFAHVLVNYDLPWNPMVVEQRIGRLDRIGQMSDKILIYNLTMPGTIEDRILERLYMRIGIFERSIGDLEAILGEAVRELTHEIFSVVLTPEELDKRIEHTAAVVERQRLMQEQLEQRSAELIGNDEFFSDAIQNARATRRYVTAEELLLYVGDFLLSHHPKCTLDTTDRPGVFDLRVNDDLRGFVQLRLPSDDLGLRLFLQRSSRGRLVLTTDPNVAQKDATSDLLTFHHPLVRAISGYYKEAPHELHPASALRVATDALPQGEYVVFVFISEITGARPAKDLACVAFRKSDGYVVDADTSEDLLWLLLTEAASQPTEDRPAASDAEDLAARAEEVLIQRLNRSFDSMSRVNEAFIEGRLRSLTATFESTLKTRQTRLEVAQERKRDLRYIRMLEGGIRNLRSDFENKRRMLSDSRAMSKSFRLHGAALVEVFHG